MIWIYYTFNDAEGLGEHATMEASIPFALGGLGLSFATLGAGIISKSNPEMVWWFIVGGMTLYLITGLLHYSFSIYGGACTHRNSGMSWWDRGAW